MDSDEKEPTPSLVPCFFFASGLQIPTAFTGPMLVDLAELGYAGYGHSFSLMEILARHDRKRNN